MLTRELGREPTMEELAEAAGLEREEIVLALEANREVAVPSTSRSMSATGRSCC